jgi:hypothetical protein
MSNARWAALATLALVACGRVDGGTAEPADSGVGDGARDSRADHTAAPKDAATEARADAFLDATVTFACFTASGELDDSLKACQSDGDCTIEEEQTDCCGTTLYVGVAQGSTAAFAACESAWAAHFPGCGCASGAMHTEDGESVSSRTSVRAHCTDFTESAGICRTYVPSGDEAGTDAGTTLTFDDAATDAGCHCHYSDLQPQGACMPNGLVCGPPYSCGGGCGLQACTCVGGEWSCAPTPPC